MPPEVKSSTPLEPAAPVRRASVVIVTWNCEPALRRCLTALSLAEARESFEVIVVDRASRDGCPRIDAEFPWVTVLRLPRNFGTSRARNIGIRTAQTDLILLLSPFVELAPPAVRTTIELMSARDEVAAAAIPLTGGEIDTLVVPDAARLAEWCQPGQEADFVRALVVRRGFLQGMNYFDEKRYADAGGELELFWQLRNAGKQIVPVEGAAGTLHPFEFGVTLDGAARDRVFAERTASAAAFLTKHQGFGSGLGFHLKQILRSLTAPRRAFLLLSGARIDGTQEGILS